MWFYSNREDNQKHEKKSDIWADMNQSFCLVSVTAFVCGRCTCSRWAWAHLWIKVHKYNSTHYSQQSPHLNISSQHGKLNRLLPAFLVPDEESKCAGQPACGMLHLADSYDHLVWTLCALQWRSGCTLVDAHAGEEHYKQYREWLLLQIPKWVLVV